MILQLLEGEASQYNVTNILLELDVNQFWNNVITKFNLMVGLDANQFWDMLLSFESCIRLF
jgi:hypothetical protein